MRGTVGGPEDGAGGAIAQQQTVSTGGLGRATQPPFGFPITDSQAALDLTAGGRLLFAVNAGDSTISAFRATRHGLVLVDRVSSGGTEPISLASRGSLLYVLNEQSGSITGFRFSGWSGLWQIPRSTRSLSTAGPGAIAAQIGFSPDGRLLTVSERCYFAGCAGQPKGVLDTFAVGWDGRVGPAQQHASDDFGPFGFAYVNDNQLIVSNTGFIGNPPNPGDPTLFTGTTSSYLVGRFGDVVPNGGPVASGGRGACWVVITNDRRYAFVTNSLSTFPPGDGRGGLSRYAIGLGGRLTLLGQTDVTQRSRHPGSDVPDRRGAELRRPVSVRGGDDARHAAAAGEQQHEPHRRLSRGTRRQPDPLPDHAGNAGERRLRSGFLLSRD